MGTFKKGALFGGILGAAVIWLNTSTKGKKYRDQLLDQATDIYKDVETKIQGSGAFDKMTKNKYVTLVKEAVDTYAIENGLAESTKKMIVTLISGQWTSVKKHLKK